MNLGFAARQLVDLYGDEFEDALASEDFKAHLADIIRGAQTPEEGAERIAQHLIITLKEGL